MKRLIQTLLSLVLLSGASAPAWAASDVFLLGTLYKRHDQVPAYSVDALVHIVEKVAPDILVLDVTPEELRKRTVHPSKIEYTTGVFPLMDKRQFISYPAEPAEPMFSEIVEGLKGRLQQFEQEQPALSATFKRTEKNMYAVLGKHWTSAAKVQDEVTSEMIDSAARLQAEIVGPVMKDADERWDRHTADTVSRAVREHPGKRVLVLTGIRNRPLVQRHLQADASIKLVDMPAWLAQAGF
jgi:hypothetical protein